ncbi:MAG: DUF4325 domain-containing protein [Proteobacteria bacterium]|nr:DUF4325 domain-containing protein [Pseudomonadota bacterium]
MTIRKRGQKIRQQILRDVKYHPNDIAQHISDIFQISRQATHKHLKKLIDEGWLESTGATRSKVYKLGYRREHVAIVPLDKSVSEHEVYDKEFHTMIEGLPKNIQDIVFYGFTEMVNNAIDHSEGSHCTIVVTRNKNNVKISVSDNGEGIFKRITRLKRLSDEKQAILELYKGKLTTDPDNHSGQGIFFTSKMFDVFAIFSQGLQFHHQYEEELDYISDDEQVLVEGTSVLMDIAIESTRTENEIFDQYSGSDEEGYAFNKTIIPVRMARINKENLVSRSQAKRLLARIENFKYVIFDFQGVETIGQAFGDEIFRVYFKRHSEISISYINTTDNVLRMIKRAESHANIGV